MNIIWFDCFGRSYIMAFSPCNCYWDVSPRSGNSTFRCDIYEGWSHLGHLKYDVFAHRQWEILYNYFVFQGEYLYIGAGLFTIVFCIIEMDKPDKPHNFEPQIYTMERGARDKLIADYNTMNIWDFNEKYGDLWDFTVTVKKEDIMKR